MEFFQEDDKDRMLVWPEKSMLAIEEYIFARYYMYQNVYLHKTTRGFEKTDRGDVVSGEATPSGRH